LHLEIAGSASHDRIVVTQANGLTTNASAANPILIDLRQQNSTAKWITPGTFPLIQFAGNFSGNADASFELTEGSKQVGLTYQFVVSGNTLNLVIEGADPSIWNVDAMGSWTNAANWQNGV